MKTSEWIIIIIIIIIIFVAYLGVTKAKFPQNLSRSLGDETCKYLGYVCV
jgi:uncharacterized protein YpmB